MLGIHVFLIPNIELSVDVRHTCVPNSEYRVEYYVRHICVPNSEYRVECYVRHICVPNSEYRVECCELAQLCAITEGIKSAEER